MIWLYAYAFDRLSYNPNTQYMDMMFYVAESEIHGVGYPFDICAA